MNYLEISGWQKSLTSGKIENLSEQPIPWYSFPAIEFIEGKLDKHFRVFEYGCGASTLFYAEKVGQVISIEHDRVFFETQSVNIPSNVKLVLVENISLYAGEILKYEDNYFDLIVIDGIERESCAYHCEHKLKSTGIIIFDNSDREENNRAIRFLMERGFKRIDFYGLVASQRYKSCTSIFFKDATVLSNSNDLPFFKKSCLGVSLGQIENKLQMEKNIMAQKHIKNLCLFLTNYYPNFLSSIYRKKPEISFLNFKRQKDFLLSEFFGDSDFYSEGLKKVDGWDADDIIMNCVPLQQAWAKEHNFNSNDLIQILIEQIRRENPDVVYLHDMGVGTKEFIAAIRPYTRLVVGQIACPLFPQADYHGFDIIISSFPHYVERFRQQGITAYYQPLAFDSLVLEKIGQPERIYPVTFVGGLSQAHQKGTEFLEELAHHVPIEFWGYGSEYLAEHTLIKQRHHGEVWGLDMFSILAQSKITINRHIDVAENYANNMRLFEATGCGALLITDYKDNLHELFEIGKEIIAYRSVGECVNLIKYYLEHPEEAKQIALAGQLRTLREHSYTDRMKQTALILEEHLHKKQNLSQASEQPMLNTPEHIIQQQALALCEQANIAMSEENFEGALQLFDGAARIYNQIDNLQYARAICLSQLGRFQEAKEALEAELQLNPHKLECQNLLQQVVSRLNHSDGNLALSSSEIKANSTAPNLDWLHKALKQAGYDIDVSDTSPLSTEERRRLPEFEYLPNGWNTQDKYIQGWNIQSIVQKSVETFPVLKASLESANTFSEQPIEHNNKLAFAYVLALAARNKDRISILDWGGGIGQYYLLAKAILPKDVHIDYYCKDLPAFCHAGKQLLPDVSFYDNEEDCFQKNYDLVFASSAIQYSQNWQQLVQQLASITKEYLYITRTPVVQNVPSFVVVQRPYQYGYQTEYKGWFINRQEFLNCASKLPLSLVREFLVMEHCHPVNAPEPSVSRGFLFKKQGSN